MRVASAATSVSSALPAKRGDVDDVLRPDDEIGRARLDRSCRLRGGVRPPPRVGVDRPRALWPAALHDRDPQRCRAGRCRSRQARRRRSPRRLLRPRNRSTPCHSPVRGRPLLRAICGTNGDGPASANPIWNTTHVSRTTPPTRTTPASGPAGLADRQRGQRHAAEREAPGAAPRRGCAPPAGRSPATALRRRGTRRAAWNPAKIATAAR